MAGISEERQIKKPDGTTYNITEMFEAFTGPGATEPLRLMGDIVVQITGTATAVTWRVERASSLVTDPALLAGNSVWAPADDMPYDQSGNPATGIDIAAYEEPAIGWWRVRIIAANGPVNINMTGVDA